MGCECHFAVAAGPGTEVTVLVSRNGKEKSFEVVLDALPSDDIDALASANGRNNSSNSLGLAVEPVDQSSLNLRAS